MTRLLTARSATLGALKKAPPSGWGSCCSALVTTAAPTHWPSWNQPNLVTGCRRANAPTAGPDTTAVHDAVTENSGASRSRRRVRQPARLPGARQWAVSYTHLRAHETRHDLVCRL